MGLMNYQNLGVGLAAVGGMLIATSFVPDQLAAVAMSKSLALPAGVAVGAIGAGLACLPGKL
ncbi:MAG: hypothetical protein Q7S22_05920 [Candidatus Micrarchaeota archaeon]|nr:hypothetical protein [Candidatus Micrarchaeota archaeon]